MIWRENSPFFEVVVGDGFIIFENCYKFEYSFKKDLELIKFEDVEEISKKLMPHEFI